MKFRIATLLGFISLVSVSHAATLTWTGAAGTTDWSTAMNWDLNQVPGAADRMIIGGSAVVDFNTTFTSSLGNGSVVIDLNNTAQLNLNGGSLTFSDGNANTSPLNIADDAVFNLVGGTHSLLGRVDIFNPGIIRVTGSNSTNNLRQQAKSGGGNTFEFIFDATGVSSLDYYSYINPSSNSLFVDGSAFTGSTGTAGLTIPLINSTNLLGGSFSPANITVVGLGQQGNTTVGWVLTQDQDTDDISITIFVPEPSRALLIFASLGAIAFRRRRRD